MSIRAIVFVLCVWLPATFIVGQQQLLQKLEQLDVDKLDRVYTKTNERINKFLQKSLAGFQKKQDRLLQKAAKKDSAAAKLLQNSWVDKYDGMLQQLANPQALINKKLTGNYIARIDSVGSLFGFASTSNLTQKMPNLKEFGRISAQIKLLQTQMHSAEALKKLMQEQTALLKNQFQKLGLDKEINKLKQQGYYYQQQVQEYKQMLSDPDKLTKKALELAADLPAYREFMSQNSQLAQLFRLPGAGGANNTAATAIPGLQTQAQVQQQLQQQLGAGGVNPMAYLQTQMGQATQQLDALKNKLNELGRGSEELDMPDFKPNKQKTKSFWKRLEYGMNIQSQRSNTFLPSTTDIGLLLGYKLNDKSTVGMGLSYKLGLGKNIQNIAITHEGVGIRTYVDIKAKGSIWITGGLEYNYQQAFREIEQLKNLSAWQRSGLIGVSKKYRIGKSKQGNMQLLWDFLSYS
ncbi:MAG: hypothetical protein K2X37_02995, partial [Chitinophagaceae bacterium]|nr:hypothetical protein [Chitinophagaceae bacterium]